MEEVCWMVNILLALKLQHTYFGLLQLQIPYPNMFED